MLNNKWILFWEYRQLEKKIILLHFISHPFNSSMYTSAFFEAVCGKLKMFRSYAPKKFTKFYHEITSSEIKRIGIRSKIFFGISVADSSNAICLCCTSTFVSVMYSILAKNSWTFNLFMDISTFSIRIYSNIFIGANNTKKQKKNYKKEKSTIKQRSDDNSHRKMKQFKILN